MGDRKRFGTIMLIIVFFVVGVISIMGFQNASAGGPPPYTVVTEASPNGKVPIDEFPVVNPINEVTITAVEGLFGSFSAMAALAGPEFTVNMDCQASDGTAEEHTLDCIHDGEFNTPGKYCWTVTVTENSGNYSPSEVIAKQTKLDCFEIPEVNYTVETEAFPNGMIPIDEFPVVNPTNVVTVTAVDGLFGNFGATATFAGPVFTEFNVDCTGSLGTGDEHTLVCSQFTEYNTPGEYCWTVTVTEFSGNYNPSEVISKQTKIDCFEIP